MDRPTLRRPAVTLILAGSLAALLGACAVTTTSPSSAPSASATPAPSPVASATPTDPASALRISAPWVLDDAFPDVAAQLRDGVMDGEGFREVAVRHVTGPNGESAFLLAADAGLTPDIDLAEYARKLSQEGLTGAGIEAIGDHEVALLQTDEVDIIAWLEPPLLVAVYAADPDTARRIAEAVLGR